MNKIASFVIVILLAINAAGTWILVTQRKKVDRMAIGRERASVIEKYSAEILDEFGGNAAKAREEGARRAEIHRKEVDAILRTPITDEEIKAVTELPTNKPPTKKPLTHDPNNTRWRFPAKK